MANPLEVTLKYGEKTHHIVVKEGDTEAASAAKQSVEFIIDLFAGSNDRKRVQPKEAAPIAPRTPFTSTSPASDKPAGGGK